MGNFYHDISRGIIAGTITGIIVFLAPRILKIPFLSDMSDLQLAWAIALLGYIIFRFFMWVEHIRNAFVYIGEHDSNEWKENLKRFCLPANFFFEDAAVILVFWVMLLFI